MIVFKFGGGVLRKGRDAFQLLDILKKHSETQIIVVVSAFYKITSKLETLFNTHFLENRFDGNLFRELKTWHYNFIEEIFKAEEKNSIRNEISDVFEEIKKKLSEQPGQNYHFECDKIISYGEILSSKIIYAFLKSNKINCSFKDIREMIVTDSNYSEAKVLWDETAKNIQKACTSFKGNICLTQGFIAVDAKGHTTTLGREGSDFTASVIAFSLSADKVIFWKEVEGIYNADPAKTKDYKLLEKLSYKEALEQAFYGAKILHPKTIKPLQNKKIPIFVKSFHKPEEPGTEIMEASEICNNCYPEIPIYIIEEKQILISVSSKDFSFISENSLGLIFNLLSKHHIKVNMMQVSAISFSISVTNDPHKIPHFTEELKSGFNVLYNENLKLITIRHYSKDAVKTMLSGKEVMLEQVSRNTARYLVKENS